MGFVNFTKVVLETEVDSRRGSQTFIPRYQEKEMGHYALLLCRHYNALLFVRYLVCFKAVARGLDDVSNNRLKCADVQGISRP